MAERFLYLVTDERGLDPDQFADAQIYATARTLDEARRDRTEAGCGVIIKCREVGAGEVEWHEVVR